MSRRRVNRSSLICWYMFKTSWRHLCKTSRRFLEDVFSRRLEDVFAGCLNDVLKTSWRRLEDLWPRWIEWSWSRHLLKTYGEGEYIRLDQDVFWRRRRKTSSRRLQDVFIKTNVCWVVISKSKILNIEITIVC